MVVVLVSFETKKDALKAANYLVDNKLAACVEFFPVHSIYFWDNKKISAQEYSGIIKTTEEKYDQIENVLKNLLNYTTPQIITLNASASKSYLDWVKKSVK